MSNVIKLTPQASGAKTILAGFKGEPGKQGPPGKDGRDGRDGKDGKDGAGGGGSDVNLKAYPTWADLNNAGRLQSRTAIAIVLERVLADLPHDFDSYIGCWARLPGGMLVQWGRAMDQPRPGQYIGVFPVAFEEPPLVLLTPQLVSASGDSIEELGVARASEDRFLAACKVSGSGADWVSYVAIGKAAEE